MIPTWVRVFSRVLSRAGFGKPNRNAKLPGSASCCGFLSLPPEAPKNQSAQRLLTAGVCALEPQRTTIEKISFDCWALATPLKCQRAHSESSPPKPRKRGGSKGVGSSAGFKLVSSCPGGRLSASAVAFFGLLNLWFYGSQTFCCWLSSTQDLVGPKPRVDRNMCCLALASFVWCRSPQVGLAMRQTRMCVCVCV